MKITRVWSMPNKHTFSINPIYKLLKKYIPNTKNKIIVDPFSDGETEFANLTNDLNPKVKATHHMDALKFLRKLPSNYADIILYDPPYSPRQVSECYHHFGYHVSMWDTSAGWRAKQCDEIGRIIKHNGLAISFGWNSNGIGKKRGFRIIRILLVASGGSHNDTIMTIERKVK